MNRGFSIGVLIITALFGASSHSYAHHAINAQYDLNVPPVEKKGVLVKAENLNPHPKWYFDVTLPDGTVEHWILQTSAPAALVRMGLKPKSDLKAGDTYTFKAAKARDGSTMGIVTELVLPDGRDFKFKYAAGELADAPVASN